MPYLNLASATKLARAAQINTAIGNGGSMVLYSGTAPASPDYPASGSVLVSLPLSSPAGIVTLAVQAATVANGGSGGVNGNQMVAGTTGTGSKFQASVTITSGAITAVLGIVVAGAYSVAPTNIMAEPVTGAGLSGATLSLVLTGQLTFNAITQSNATGTGIAGYARIVNSSGVGIVDLDCGTQGASVTMNTTSIAQSGPVLASAELLVES